jgi:MFS family permease
MKTGEKGTRIAFVICEAFEYFISIFVTSTMLGYLLDTVGFSDSLQGILGTVATFTCGAQLFALFLHGRRVKRISAIGNLINEGCFVLLYLLPFVKIDADTRTALMVVLLLLGHLIKNAINPSKIAMYMESVPLERRGGFTAVKEMISLAGGIAISLVMGRVADTYRDADGLPTGEYYVICAVTLILLTLVQIGSVLAADERCKVGVVRTSPLEVTKRLFRDDRFVKVVGVGILWNVASALSVSFFASYLRDDLEFNFTVIAILTTVSSLSRILASPILGRIADRYSFVASLSVSFALAGIGFLAVVFTAPATRWLYMVYACFYGFAMAGINSGVMNLVYDYVEPGDRATALGVKNSIGGILAFFTALLSGAIMSAVQERGGIHIFGYLLYPQQLLALLSCAVSVALIFYMRAVIAPLGRASDAVGRADTDRITSSD